MWPCAHAQIPLHLGFVAKFAGKDDVIKMHVGLPPDETFPLRWLSAGTAFTSGGSGSGGEAEHIVMVLEPGAVSAAQQYIFSAGYAELLTWASRLVARCHAPTVPVSTVITAGAVSGQGGAGRGGAGLTPKSRV